MNIYNAAELISVFLTNASIFLVVFLLCVWWKGVKGSISIPRKERESSHWFLLGVFVSFFGSLFDNTYWNIAWLSSLKNLPSKDWLFQHGVFSNIPSRNIATILSTYLHLKAYFIMTSSIDKTKRDRSGALVVNSLMASFVITSIIWFLL